MKQEQLALKLQDSKNKQHMSRQQRTDERFKKFNCKLKGILLDYYKKAKPRDRDDSKEQQPLNHEALFVDPHPISSSKAKEHTDLKPVQASKRTS